MKTSINNFKVVPKTVKNNFELCVFGQLNEEQQQWVDNNNLKTYQSGNYTNIIIPEEVNFSSIFQPEHQFEWLDGFSPNLNKKLHIAQSEKPGGL